MQITKKEDSVMVELSQAELSAIKLMAESALQAGAAIFDIEIEADMRNEGSDTQPETLSVYSTLMYCHEFLRVIGNHAESDEVGIHAFASLFIPMALHDCSEALPLE